ncbi:MAG: hypothetical protein WCN92_04020, partial [Eubacteriales bacterium]
MNEKLKRTHNFSNKMLLCLLDALAINISFFIALYMYRTGDYPPISNSLFLFITIRYDRLLLVTVGYLIIFRLFGLYTSIWKYAGTYELFQIVLAVVMGGILSTGIDKIGEAL